MIQLTNADFHTLCAAGTVRERIGALEGKRRAAVRQFMLRGSVGLAVSIATLVGLLRADWPTTAIVVFIILLIATFFAAAAPLTAASEGLKHPVLEELAKRVGMEYLPADFDPPAFGAARLLFGGATRQSFTDLFHGKDEDGHGYAVYEACLQRKAGKNTVTIFQGQLYGLQRRSGRSSGITVILPDRKLFNFFKPARDMERVKIEGDEAFEKKFEVYSTAPLEARQLLFDSELRRRLLQLREQGRIYIALNPEEALVGIWGKDRFEPGSMLRSRPAEERARLMFDDVCASLDLLGELKTMLG